MDQVLRQKVGSKSTSKKRLLLKKETPIKAAGHASAAGSYVTAAVLREPETADQPIKEVSAFARLHTGNIPGNV